MLAALKLTKHGGVGGFRRERLLSRGGGHGRGVENVWVY